MDEAEREGIHQGRKEGRGRGEGVDLWTWKVDWSGGEAERPGMM